MSSPIAKEKKSPLDRWLIKYHKKSSHNHRVEQLANLFTEQINSLPLSKPVRFLDVGCGDMTIAKEVAAKLPTDSYTCIDIYPNTEGWEHYMEFDGKNFPFEDKTFDVALFSDVLHHDYENIEILLREAKRVATYVIIKDHFEYGLYSRKVLQLADIIGNLGYGVSIPKRYLTQKSFENLTEDCELREVKRMCPIQLYDHTTLAKLIFKSKYQFISVLN